MYTGSAARVRHYAKRIAPHDKPSCPATCTLKKTSATCLSTASSNRSCRCFDPRVPHPNELFRLLTSEGLLGALFGRCGGLPSGRVASAAEEEAWRSLCEREWPRLCISRMACSLAGEFSAEGRPSSSMVLPRVLLNGTSSDRFLTVMPRRWRSRLFCRSCQRTNLAIAYPCGDHTVGSSRGLPLRGAWNCPGKAEPLRLMLVACRGRIGSKISERKQWSSARRFAS